MTFKKATLKPTLVSLTTVKIAVMQAVEHKMLCRQLLRRTYFSEAQPLSSLMLSIQWHVP
jgi:hypothetical protein